MSRDFHLIREREREIGIILSLCVDVKTCDLGEVRCGGEVEYVHIVKDVVSVEPAKEEESRIGYERGMITPRRRRLAEGRARLILQGH
jgi:hypothetical protein